MQSQIVKTNYDEQGEENKEYTPGGTKENTTTRNKYEILRQMIQSEISQEKKDARQQIFLLGKGIGADCLLTVGSFLYVQK